jgi:hypothetical protein
MIFSSLASPRAVIPDMLFHASKITAGMKNRTPAALVLSLALAVNAAAAVVLALVNRRRPREIGVPARLRPRRGMDAQRRRYL